MKKFLTLFSLALLTMSAGAANTYVKVASIDQLEEGKKYILVNEENSVAMGALYTAGSTNYGTSVEISLGDNVIDIEGTDVVELIAAAPGQDATGNPTWNFRMGEEGNYIAWTSGNSLTGINLPASNNSAWLPTLTDDGVILKNRVDNSRILQYNASSPRFACYTSSQQPAVLYVEYVPQEDGITTLAQANAVTDDEAFTFDGDAVVTLQKSGYLFLRDNSGYGMISGTVDGTFENGQVLSQGWNATKTSVNGWVRYTDATDLSASGETNAELAAVQVATGIEESMINAYVCYQNVTFSMFQRKITLPDGTAISIYDLFGINMPGGFGPDNRHWNVYGVIGIQNGALKFCPAEWVLYVEPESLRGDVDDDGDVDIDDVTRLIDVVLGKDVTYNADAADCNTETGDGSVDIDDVTALINRVLTGSWD